MAEEPQIPDVAGAHRLRKVNPHDTKDLPDGVCRAIYVGTGGNLIVVAEDDSEPIPLMNVRSGETLDVRAKAVRKSGTTAKHIVAMY